MYTDIYLSFPDESAAKAVLFTQVPTAYDQDGNVTATEDRPDFTNIDSIGVIYKDGQPIPGWHVNVRLMPGEDGSALLPYQVNPKTPTRIWG